MTSSPSAPVLLEPSPWRPRCALYSGLKRKCTSVLCFSLASMMTSPPRPPSPPEGPPRGTNFSRRKAMQPLPPPPDAIRIFASSTNIFSSQSKKPRRPTRLYSSNPIHANTCRSSGRNLRLRHRIDFDKLAHLSTVDELNHAIHFREKRVVFTAADVQARLDASAALAHDDGAAQHSLTAKCFYAKPLCVRIAAVPGTA